MADTSTADVLLAGPKLSGNRASTDPVPGYLFGPLVDFLYLGGGSLVILGLVIVFLPKGMSRSEGISLAVALMTFINQPHFAHSYQMFYRDFRAKAFGAATPAALRWRYQFAGIGVPLLLVAYLAFATLNASAIHSAKLLGYSVNAMLFLAGWHYVKQGYGILMVDSVQKGVKFSDLAKLVFRANGYAGWILAWVGMNYALHHTAYYDGVGYYAIPMPSYLYFVAFAACEVTTIATLGILFRQWRTTRTVPWNGVFGYVASIYLWIVFGGVNPIMFIVVPSFHSLQYLTVVWRYQLNAGPSRRPGRFARVLLDGVWPDGAWRKLTLFVMSGVLLGYLAFAGIPLLLDAHLAYDRSVFGPWLFVFLFAIFLNIHHYFMDNVIWRRGNPDVQRFLFQPKAAAAPQ